MQRVKLWQKFEEIELGTTHGTLCGLISAQIPGVSTRELLGRSTCFMPNEKTIYIFFALVWHQIGNWTSESQTEQSRVSKVELSLPCTVNIRSRVQETAVCRTLLHHFFKKCVHWLWSESWSWELAFNVGFPLWRHDPNRDIKIKQNIPQHRGNFNFTLVK